jgi:PIN domain nuclease of toxin-antitoxin system
LSILLDTHIWIWWLIGAPDLRKSEAEALDSLAEKNLPFISGISIWEAQMLVSRKRLVVTEPFDQWIRRMTSADTVRVLPLDADVVSALNDLPASFHGDPADRLILSTARAHVLQLATHDRKIRKSRLATIWKPKP